MKIYGLQKMTLLDFPEHVACTVFTGGCDFRCPFCHNYELATGEAEPVMEEDGLCAFLEKRKGLLDGVALTGGEPCLQKELPALMRRIREMGFAVKLDTNGNHPDMLRRVLEEGLCDYVAMDIKNSPEKYAATCGLEHLDLSAVTESIRLLIESGTDCEFRTTVVAELHEEKDFTGIGRMIQGAGKYYLQSFTDRDTVPFGGFHAPDPAALRRFADAAGEFVKDVRIRGV